MSKPAVDGFQVSLGQFAETIWVVDGETILDAAVAAEIPYPHGCTYGNCGACKSELVTGKVEMLRYSPFALSDVERDAGMILVCRAIPESDCEVAYVE